MYMKIEKKKLVKDIKYGKFWNFSIWAINITTHPKFLKSAI